MFMKKYKDILIIASLLLITILVSFLFSLKDSQNDALTIIKEKLKNTQRVVVSIGEQNQYDKVTYDYYNNKHEVIEEITDEKEIEKIKNSIMDMYIPNKDEIFTDSYSTNLLQFFDAKNQKICEYNFQYLMIGYTTKIRVLLPQESYNNLNVYFENYYKLQ